MRIATANSYASSLSALMNRQSDLSDTQEQMTTGKRVNRASDDPAAAARSERAQAEQQRTIANQRGVDASSNAMTLTESALGDSVDLLQTAREALVQAGNATYSDAERKTLSDQLVSLRQQLFSIANRTDSGGTFLFGGQAASHQPFVDSGTGVQFQGSAGSSQAASGEPLPLTSNGASTWMSAGTGNGVFAASAVTSTGSAWIDVGSVTDPAAITGSTYSIQFSVSGGATTYSVLKDGVATAQTNLPFRAGGQAIQIDGMSANISGDPANGDEFKIVPSTPTLSVFDTLDKAIADLKSPGRSNSQIAQANNTNLANLDSVLSQVTNSRSQVGSVLNRADAATGRLASLKLAGETEQSNAEDLDMTQAISSFSSQQTGYDAALKAYTLVQKLSLFNYLSP
jgi:flagellar hook-associated protein 3 FlgL